MVSATQLVVWGFVIHRIADLPLQSDWMAKNKASLRHPAGYVHAGIHGLALALIFGWVAVPLAIAHLLIDTRVPLIWWGRTMRQTTPNPKTESGRVLMDIGSWVRFEVDQTFHLACIALAAILIA
jgi:hypothetical protein